MKIGRFFGVYDKINDVVLYCTRDRGQGSGLWCKTLNLPRNHFFVIDEDTGNISSHKYFVLINEEMGHWSNGYAEEHLRELVETLKEEGKV